MTAKPLPRHKSSAPKKGRPAYGFLLLDLPSDHEIEGNIVTECQVIRAILHNRGLGAMAKIITATTTDGLMKVPAQRYSQLGFVHLAAHASPKGIALIGDRARWSLVADWLRKIAPALNKDQKRVLCLSCCYSSDGVTQIESQLQGHFTHAYHFADETVGFATAMTVWSMFYRKKTLARPLKAVVDPINTFFERETIVFREF